MHGNLIEGHSDVQVHIGYDYQATSSYESTSQFGASGNGDIITTNRALRELTIWQYVTLPVDEIDARVVFGLGGLSFTGQNLYDPYGQTWYGGDGTRRTVQDSHFHTLSIYAGGGSSPPNGVPATTGNIGEPNYLAVGPDGTLYIPGSTYLMAVDPKTKVITQLAGNGEYEYPQGGSPGDGQPANAQPVSANGVAVGQDGNIYFTTLYTNRVRMLNVSTGILTTLAGNGTTPEECVPGTKCSDGMNATSVGLYNLQGIAIDSLGAVYFAEVPALGPDISDGARIRKIEHDGTLSTTLQSTALSAGLRAPNGIKITKHGAMYVADGENEHILRIDPSGAVTIVAGSHRGYDGDGGPATEAGIWAPQDIAVEDDGSFYFTDEGNEVLRFVDTSGIIHTITNPNALTQATLTPAGYGGPAGAVNIYGGIGLASRRTTHSTSLNPFTRS